MLGLCEPFSKKIGTILVLNFIGNLLIGISYLIVVGYSGVATLIAIFARDIKNKDKKNITEFDST